MKDKKKVVCFGVEFFVIPPGFGDIMVQVMMKANRKLTKKQGKTKIYNYLDVQRKTKRKELKVRSVT